MVLPWQWHPRRFEVMNGRVTRRLATLIQPIVLVSLVALFPGCGKRAADSLGPSQAIAQGGSAPSPAASPVPSPSPKATG